jgi:protein involved in polysaccharide export with SLBB domain
MNRMTPYVILCLALAAAASPARAQAPSDWEAQRLLASRKAIEDLLRRLDQGKAPGARAEAELARRRLQEGDFQAGDRILVEVEAESLLSDTFSVEAGRVVNMPVIGSVPLAGILRSELEAHLTSHIARFVREPTVRARALIPMAVTGEVARPGFYSVPSELPFTELLMLAGGTTPDAKLSNIRIERESKRIWEPEALGRAITEGRTIDQLNLRAGDRIVVPARRNTQTTIQILGLILAVPVAILVGAVVR